MRCKYLCDFWIPSFKEGHVLIISWLLNKDMNNSTITDTKVTFSKKKKKKTDVFKTGFFGWVSKWWPSLAKQWGNNLKHYFEINIKNLKD